MTRRRGLTLVEILVVVAIIGVVVAILLPTLSMAITRARVARAQAEILGMQNALTLFNEKYGDYPPSRIILVESGDYSPSTIPPAYQQLALRSVAYIRKFFPQLQNAVSFTGPTWVIHPKPAQPSDPKSIFLDWNGNDTPDAGFVVLQGHQCLALFLGGINGVSGWGKNPQFPVVPDTSDPLRWNANGTGYNRSEPIYKFSTDRLLADANGFPGYTDPLGIGPDARYYMYFRSYGRQYDPEDCNVTEASTDGTVSSIATVYQISGTAVVSSAPNPYTFSATIDPSHMGQPVQFINNSTFQIISPGPDRLYGVGGQYTKDGHPALPFDPVTNQSYTGQSLPPDVRQREVDNITNFADYHLD